MNKLNIHLNVVHWIKRFLPVSARMTYYHAFIVSYLIMLVRFGMVQPPGISTVYQLS